MAIKEFCNVKKVFEQFTTTSTIVLKLPSLFALISKFKKEEGYNALEDALNNSMC